MRILLALLALGVAACAEDPGSGNLTAEENRELNEAAEMLDRPPDSLAEEDEAATGDVLVSNDAEAEE